MSFWGNLWDKTTDALHTVTGIPTADEKRNAQKAMRDQVNAYKQQTELTRNEINRKQTEEKAEKRRVEEKQIRSLRRNYRSNSLLGSGSNTSSSNDMTQKLGG